MFWLKLYLIVGLAIWCYRLWAERKAQDALNFIFSFVALTLAWPAVLVFIYFSERHGAMSANDENEETGPAPT